MKTNDYYFDSDDNRHLVYTKVWYPQANARGILLILHGLFEHTGRYEEAAEFFTSQGFIVYAYDQLGHGRTGSGNLGFFGNNNGLRHLLKDCKHMVESIKEEYPNLPLFILGHSFGSFIVRSVISDNKIAQSLSGAIIAGTAGIDDDPDKAIELAKNAVNKYGPKAVDNELLGKIFAGFGNSFNEDEGPLGWLTSIKGRQKKYLEDELSGFNLTTAASRDLFELIKQVSLSSTFKETDNNLPILLISGQDDPVGNFSIGVRQVAVCYLKSGQHDLTYMIYPHVRHEVLYDFPAYQNKSLPFIADWCLMRI